MTFTSTGRAIPKAASVQLLCRFTLSAWKYGSKWTLLLEIKCDHTQQPREALQFHSQLWKALSHRELGEALRKKGRHSFSGIFPVCSLNPTWMFFLFPESFFLCSASSSHFSLTVISPLERVSGPFGDSHVWLHELLELTKTYSFPINLPQADTQQLRIPSMGLAEFPHLIHHPCSQRIIGQWHQDIQRRAVFF